MFEKEIWIDCTCTHCDTFQTHREGFFTFAIDNKAIFDKVARARNGRDGITFVDATGEIVFTDDDNIEFDITPVENFGVIK